MLEFRVSEIEFTYVQVEIAVEQWVGSSDAHNSNAKNNLQMGEWNVVQNGFST